MLDRDLQKKLEPWLKLWGLDNNDQLNPWLERMALVHFSAEEHLLHAGKTGDTLYMLNSGLVRLYYACLLYTSDAADE